MSAPVQPHPALTVFVTAPNRASVHLDGAVKSLEATDQVALREQIVAVMLERAQHSGTSVTASLIDDASDLLITVGIDGTVTEALRSGPHLDEPQQVRTAHPPTQPQPVMNIESDPPPTTATAAPADKPSRRPTVDDLLATRPRQRAVRAEDGWQGQVRRLTGGLISPHPGASERSKLDMIGRVRKRLDGTRTIAVLNPKGGAHKTTSTLLLAATFGRLRGGSVLAWDNNETRGTLGWRAQHAPHHRTAVNLLNDIDQFEAPSVASLTALDDYVRTQIDARFDVLASDEDAAATSTIDGEAFQRLHHMLARYYRLLIIDTGNNMRASNWMAAVDSADQLVIVSTVREDTAASAAWLLDGLAEKGFGDKVERAVTVLTSPSSKRDRGLEERLSAHFAQLTAAVTHVPYDPALVEGSTIDFDTLTDETHAAWLRASALIADQL